MSTGLIVSLTTERQTISKFLYQIFLYFLESTGRIGPNRGNNISSELHSCYPIKMAASFAFSAKLHPPNNPNYRVDHIVFHRGGLQLCLPLTPCVRHVHQPENHRALQQHSSRHRGGSQHEGRCCRASGKTKRQR